MATNRIQQRVIEIVIVAKKSCACIGSKKDRAIFTIAVGEVQAKIGAGIVVAAANRITRRLDTGQTE